MKLIRSLLTVIFFIFITTTFAQSHKRVLTFDEAISLAQKQSPDALSAMHKFRISYWQYRNYKAGLMPQLSMEAVLPRLSKGLEYFDEQFVMRNNTYYSAGLSLTQDIGLTGGSVFANANMARLDKENSTEYSAYPLINIGINQPLFGYNQFKWLRKTEPLKYNEAERKYIEDVEQINITASELFFRLLHAQIRLNIQLNNLANNDTLYQIAKGRYNIGTIAENELLQIELSFLNVKLAVSEASLDLERMMFELRSYLRLPEGVSIELVPPTTTNLIDVNPQIAITQARNNRADALAYERRLIEAQQLVNKARSENRFKADLFASYGTENRSTIFSEIFNDPSDSYEVRVGVRIPILDWGYGKGQVKLAESNMNLASTDIQQSKIDFDQEVLIKVLQFNNLPLQLQIASKSDTVAIKRYEVTKQRYLIGKIGITDLNIAQSEKDNAQYGYISALQEYWRSYFELRKLTLFDFATMKQISFDFDAIPNVD